jgi:membrane-associated phospholipid phosphatase
MDTLRHLDDRLLFDVNSMAGRTQWLHGFLMDYARYGVGLFAVLFLAGLFTARGDKTRKLAAAGWAPVGMLLALAINQPLGRAVAEARPYTTHPHILVLATRTSDFSFPSDHAVMVGAATVGLLFVARRLALVTAAAAVLMGFARVYTAAHYPWDVVAGFVFGAAVTSLGWLALRAPLVRFAGWLRRQPPLRTIFAESPLASAPQGTD